ncbi:MAG: flavodoxin [Clostridia bacterium]|nr:flavodoxin [Clostridia bacterium]
MKKILALLMTALLVFSLVACAKDNTESTTSSSESTADNTSESAPESASNNDTSSEKKPLIIYFSATGSTKKVAEYIAEEIGGRLYEVVPEEEYTSDDLNWNDKNSRVSREHDDETLRTVKLKETTVPDWESYDTVYVGYPIWWGIAAWPLSSFVAANDFSGKTVIPFCTSASSGLGDSAKLLEEATKGGTWLSGKRFSSSASKDEVASWLGEIK